MIENGRHHEPAPLESEVPHLRHGAHDRVLQLHLPEMHADVRVEGLKGMSDWTATVIDNEELARSLPDWLRVWNEVLLQARQLVKVEKCGALK
jgi:hypothetical protein